LADERIIDAKEKKVEEGTDTRNKFYGDWDVSTQPLHPRDNWRKWEADTNEIKTKTKIKNEKLIAEKYQTPFQKTKMLNEGIRNEKL